MSRNDPDKLRQKTEKELERYRSFLDRINEGCFESDLAGNIVYANKAAARRVGYSLKRFIGMNYRSYTPPNEADRIRNIYREVLRTGHPAIIKDHVVIDQNGIIKHLDLTVSLMRENESGEPVGFRGNSRDVTEQKQAREALRRNEEKYRTIIESITEAYIEIGLDGIVLFVNAATCKVLGYPRKELVGMNYRRFVSAESSERIERAYAQLFRTGRMISLMHLDAICNDGTARIYEVNAMLMRDGQDRPSGYRIVGRDITGRRRAEEALHLSEKKYRTILAEMHEGYYEIDLGGTYTFANRAACEILGYELNELIGVNYRKLTAPGTAKKMYAAFHEIFETGRPGIMLDHEIIRKDGSIRINQMNAGLIRDTSGKPIGFHIITRDITEQKRAEDNLRYISVHDALTGLYNRFYSDAEIERFRTGRIRPVSIIMIDLNDLKVVNDCHGHAAGDLYLKRAAELLKQIFRPEDMIARIGGDEFMILLPRVDKKTCLKILNRLQKRLDELNAKSDLPLRLSAGSATAHAGDDLPTLIKEADKRMYEEKARIKKAGIDKRASFTDKAFLRGFFV